MKTTLKIQNLKCSGCGNTITKKLKALPNISHVKVTVDDNNVSFEYTEGLALENAKETLKLIGYPEEGEANSLGTKAKSFVSCAIGRVS
jgi:copper chaperone